ncbi:MAG: hypothetical protein ACXACY_29435 [Candidatus Hodarchaeales archaeon]|jgi:hypothetical protein
MITIEIGSKVEFTSRRNRLVEGVVIRNRLKKSRATKKFNEHFGLDLRESHPVVEVVDLKSRTVWTVDRDIVKFIGRVNKKTLQKAIDLKGSIKAGNRAIKAKQRSRNVEKLGERNLMNLRFGDTFQVKYRNIGWKDEVFSHYTKSGKIAFKSRSTKSGVRYCWPSGARIK